MTASTSTPDQTSLRDAERSPSLKNPIYLDRPADSLENYFPTTPHKSVIAPPVCYGRLPPTPERTPTKKRSLTDAFDHLPLDVFSAKRTRSPHLPSPRFNRSPIAQPNPQAKPLSGVWARLRPTKPSPSPFSADELRRTCEAVLQQVDWDDVQEYVASNRPAAAYRILVKELLQKQVSALFRDEERSALSLALKTAVEVEGGSRLEGAEQVHGEEVVEEEDVSDEGKCQDTCNGMD